MTLLELIIVLALLGLIVAMAAPAFIVPAPVSASDLNAALGAARRAAVLRGEPVTFLADDRGAWQVDGDASPAASPIVTGTLAAPVGRLRVRVSANGTCVPEPIDGVPLQNWNALRCGFGESSQTGRP